MISLLILVCILCFLIVFLGLRKSASVSVVAAPLFISCSRPSERKEIGCWLFTISLWNKEGTQLHIDRMEVLSPTGESVPVLPPPQEHPRAAVFHHALQFPFELPASSSIIVIASVASTPGIPMDMPERCRLRVYAGDNVHDYPLFRMQFPERTS